eukprot:scaffold48020_cov26-Tisochrysis_lutea.AAC.1
MTLSIKNKHASHRSLKVSKEAGKSAPISGSNEKHVLQQSQIRQSEESIAGCAAVAMVVGRAAPPLAALRGHPGAAHVAAGVACRGGVRLGIGGAAQQGRARGVCWSCACVCVCMCACVCVCVRACVCVCVCVFARLHQRQAAMTGQLYSRNGGGQQEAIHEIVHMPGVCKGVCSTAAGTYISNCVRATQNGCKGYPCYSCSIRMHGYNMGQLRAQWYIIGAAAQRYSTGASSRLGMGGAANSRLFPSPPHLKKGTSRSPESTRSAGSGMP